MSSFQDQDILNLAQVGHNFSKLGLSRISRKRYIPFQFTMSQVLRLEQMRLLVWENVADLDQIGLAKDAQFNWSLRDWEKAIRKHMNLEITEFESDDMLIIVRNGFKLKDSCDGGLNLWRWNQRIKYYRRRKCAIKRALKIIEMS